MSDNKISENYEIQKNGNNLISGKYHKLKIQF